MSRLGSIPEEDRELHREIAVKTYEDLRGRSEKFLQYSVEYGKQAVQGAFLANGAAMIAILTLVGNSFARNDDYGSRLSSVLYFPSVLFSIGLVLSIVASGVGYLNYVTLSERTDQHSDIRDLVLYNKSVENWISPLQRLIIRVTMIVGITSVTISILAFIAGALCAGSAIASSKPSQPSLKQGCRAVMGLDGKHYHLLFCPLVEAE